MQKIQTTLNKYPDYRLANKTSGKIFNEAKGLKKVYPNHNKTAKQQYRTQATKTLKSCSPFHESPGNFSGPKSNIQTDIKRIRARVLGSKLLHFVSLTHSFIMLDAKLLKLRASM